MSRSFVLGNGISRLTINLHKLRQHGKIFGCNALYRDFTPDYLFATDQEISTEIEDSGYPKSHQFFTRNPRLEKGSKKINLNFGYSSGPIAVSYAASFGAKHIYLIGFDLTGINGKINNIYAGTPCYRPKDNGETHYGNWVNQIAAIMANQYPTTKFTRIIPDSDSYTPPNWKDIHNYHEQRMAEFLENINSTLWQK